MFIDNSENVWSALWKPNSNAVVAVRASDVRFARGAYLIAIDVGRILRAIRSGRLCSSARQ